MIPKVFIPSAIGLFLIAALPGFAEKAVGTVSSLGPLIIDGTEMSAGTAVFWPVVYNDQISTLGSTAVLVLADRSRITLARHSTAKIVSNGGRTRVTLVSGAGTYNLVSPASASLAAGSRVLERIGTSGNFSERPEGFGDRRHRGNSEIGDITTGEDQEEKHKKHRHPSPTDVD